MEARLLAQAGYEVTVITSGVQYMTGEDIRKGRGWCVEEDMEGIRVLRVWAPKNHRSSIPRRIANYLSYTLLAGMASLTRAGKADVVFAGTDPILMMPMVYVVKCLKRAAMVLDERDLYPETAIALGVIKDDWKAKIIFRMQQFFRKRATSILTATPGIRSRLATYRIPENKLHLLYNADVFIHDEQSQNQACMDLRKQIHKPFIVGYAGGLGQANDLSTLLASAEYLQNNDLGVVIIGSGERRKTYETFCKEHKFDNVFFFDAVPRCEARALLSQMDICIQPLPADDHFHHTLTSKTFDYHGLGKPMVFCGKGDTAQLLEASGGGMVVPPEDPKALADAILKLYHETDLRQRMGEAAKTWFNKNVGAEAACEIIKKAITGHA